MKYAAVVLSLAAGAFAMPQDASITSAPAAAPSAALTPQQSCAVACPAGDVVCQAACFGVARPNSSQAVDTNECAAKCDQGDGSPEATKKFEQCVQACIGSLFPSSQTVPLGEAASGIASLASNSASATGSGSPATTGGAQPSGSGTGSSSEESASATGSAAGGSETGAANANSVHIVGAGLAGFMALFAL